MASLGHNEFITRNFKRRISGMIGVRIFDTGPSCKTYRNVSISKFYLPPKCPDDKHDISLQVLTYDYCAYCIQSLHMKCAAKVINRQIKITFSLANASQWTAPYQRANDIHLHKPYREGIKLPVRRYWKCTKYLLYYMCPGTAKYP